MRTRIVVPLLAATTLAIGVENWLYFSGSGAPAAASEGDAQAGEEATDGSGADTRAALAPQTEPPQLLGVSALAALLETFDSLRSPFLPAGAEAAADLGFPTFAGLLIGSERRIAWLGDHARSEGEVYQGWTISRVEPSRVVLERDGRRFSLWLDSPRADGAGDPDPALASEQEKTP